ncbi:MAG TPA: hypothetical protein VH853_15020 [Polyangia bacterium]|nr:hypothetical protein [Polyangia bacterium]
MTSRRLGLLALVAIDAAAGPTRAQTESGAPEISIDGEKVQATPASPSGPAPPPPSPADNALERVLRSGCRDGLDDVRALRGDPSAPWADTVERLCGNVLRAPPATAGPRQTISESASANEGRGRLVLWSSLYGIWLGIAGDILIDVNSVQPAVLLPMVGMGVALGTSLVITSGHPVTTGQAWTIITGLDYGSLNGALWGGGLGLSAQGVVGLSLATSVVATPIAIFVATTRRPKAGDVELVRSSLLWGTTAGLLATAAFAPNTNAEGVWRTGAIAMDVGLGAGIGLANSFDLSRNRVLIIDAGAVGGALVGLGISLLIGGNHVTGQAAGGGALAGLVAGIAIAALATHDLDAPDIQASAPAYPALFARDADGHWAVGMPAPTPVLDTTGTRTVGASLPAVGGLF